jgi:type IV secretion system protein VirB4
MLGDSGIRERSGELYLPFVGHIGPQTILMEDGSVVAMAEVQGVPFELEDHAQRNARLRMLNTLFRNIADDNIALYSHLVRHPLEKQNDEQREFRSGFARSLAGAYRDRIVSDQLYQNTHLLSLVVSPRGALGSGTSRRLAKWRKRPGDNAERLKEELEQLWYVVASSLADFGVRRLGVYEWNGLAFSEMAEALRLLITSRWLRVPIVSGHLGASLYTDRVICGRRGFEVRDPGQSRFGTLFSFREYPAKTRPGMLNSLLAAPFSLVLSQSFQFLTRAQAHGSLSLKAAQMASANDKAASQMVGLDEAADAVASNEFVMGSHHLSLAVYGDTVGQVRDNGARARSRLADSGAVVAEESIGLEAAFWSQLPGNYRWRTRPGAISSRNFAGLSSFDNFPRGKDQGHWGRALTRFRTDGQTPYDYIPHVEDVGMTAIFGPTGSGKTALLMFLLAMFEQVTMDRNGAVVFFDKDRGGELLVRATGGTYLVLRRGEDSGMAPLRGLADTPSARDFLRHWVLGLIQSDGKGGITPDEEQRLERGIARQLQLPVEMRSVAGLREFLGHADPHGAGPRLEKWCRGQALGWAFDGAADEVRLNSAITGFDMTHLLELDQVCAPAAAYLLYRIGSVMDGRRFVMACDEFRAYLLNEQFAAVVDKFLLTVRKNNGMLILGTQQPEHVLSSSIGSSLVAQCQTKILFPSPTADRGAYVDGLKCTEGEYRAVREDMLAGRRKFLLKRDSGSVICEFDLSALPEYIAVLSGRANTVRFVDGLRKELGEAPEQWLPTFMERFKEARD